jgi:hypothetical protein
MKNKIIIPLIGALLALSGCKGDTCWMLQREPTTDAERAAVAAHVEKLLAATPQSLAGDDQDWDDAIHAAHRQARESLCRPTLWQFENDGIRWVPTGRWRYVDEPERAAQ